MESAIRSAFVGIGVNGIPVIININISVVDAALCKVAIKRLTVLWFRRLLLKLFATR